MRAALRSRGLGLLLLALCVIGANSVLFFWSLDRLVEANAWVRHTLQARLLTQEVLTSLVDAETGERGYLITSDPRYLGPYYSSFESARVQLEALRHEVSDNEEQVEKLAQLEALVEKKFAELSTVIQAHNDVGPERSRELVIEDHGRRIMDDIRAVLATMEQAEGELLEERLSTYEQAKLFTVIALIVFVATTLGLVATIFFMMRAELLRRAQAAREQSRQARELSDNIGALEKQRNDIARLNDASTFLQSCDDLAEVGRITTTLLSALLPERSGALYVYAASRNQLTAVTAWPAGEGAQEVLLPTHCWALRRGQVHRFSTGGGTPCCVHHARAAAGPESTVCVPLVAHGETLGLLTLSSPHVEAGERQERIVELVARQIAVTIANLNLRETLKEQSIRDPLTGAFNRRYLEVVAEKEMKHARRNGHELAVVMFDVDHFKRFNDVHGHPAGDRVLVSLSEFVQASIRDSDWFFRIGGEEFVLLLRESGRADAERRAREICDGIARLDMTLDGRPLPGVTISLGIAMFPEHGETLGSLLEQADKALYASKQAGRNRFTLAAA